MFAGGWTLEAAEAVCADSVGADVLDTLGQLVNKSLVVVRQHGDESRYHLLETIRQYGRDKLTAAGESARLSTSAHARAWLAPGGGARPPRRPTGAAAVFARHGAEVGPSAAPNAWRVGRPPPPPGAGEFDDLLPSGAGGGAGASACCLSHCAGRGPLPRARN